jgi:hypothetical protein
MCAKHRRDDMRLAAHALGGAASFDFQQDPAPQSLVRDIEASRLISNATGRGVGGGRYVRQLQFANEVRDLHAVAVGRDWVFFVCLFFVPADSEGRICLRRDIRMRKRYTKLSIDGVSQRSPFISPRSFSSALRRRRLASTSMVFVNISSDNFLVICSPLSTSITASNTALVMSSLESRKNLLPPGPFSSGDAPLMPASLFCSRDVW